jgi:hypothetical protein
MDNSWVKVGAKCVCVDFGSYTKYQVPDCFTPKRGVIYTVSRVYNAPETGGVAIQLSEINRIFWDGSLRGHWADDFKPLISLPSSITQFLTAPHTPITETNERVKAKVKTKV